MFVAAQFGTGQVFWSIFWFFLFLMWIALVINVFVDMVRSRDLSGVSKAVWTIVIVFFPFIGIFVYLIARGDKMAERHLSDVREREEAMRDYIRSTAGGASAADQLASLAELHDAGKLSDEEYAQAKAKVISS